MKITVHKRSLSLAGMAIASLLLSSCTAPSSPGPEAITKVNPYHFNGAYPYGSTDAMVNFEFMHHYHGAVDTADLKEKLGNYYTVYWKTKAKGIPTTIRLDYRQGKTGPKINTREVVVDSPRGKNTTKFAIVGEEYQENGPVTQWKASIIRNGTVITEYESFGWK